MRDVFTMFMRIDSEIGCVMGGLGTGRTLAKGLIHRHGGGFEVNSAGAGLGSDFTIWLPRTLIVDDGQIQCDVTARLHAANKRILKLIALTGWGQESDRQRGSRRI